MYLLPWRGNCSFVWISASVLPSDIFHNLGLLRTISLSCRLATKHLVRERLVRHVYDNINFMRKTEEQTLGHSDAMENGTCTTIFPLVDARPDNMKVSDLVNSQDQARPLTIRDIHFTKDEGSFYRRCMVHNILRIIVAFGGAGFARFRDDLVKAQPRTDTCIPVHKTKLYPLPSMPIDESSNTGNAQVIDCMQDELEYDSSNQELPSTGR